MDMPNIEMILDQGQTGSCVAHALIVALKILNWQLTNKIIDFSPMALYGTRYAGQYTGEGMIPSQAAHVVYKEGAFYKKDFDEKQDVPLIIDLVKEFKDTHPDLVKEALKFTISGYARISPYNSNYINQIKKALKNNMPVIVGYTLYESFYNTGEDGKVPVPKVNKEKECGGHEMLIVGWTKNNEWIIINSWGINEGFQGMYLIPFSYKPDDIISISDKIAPYKHKAKEIEFQFGDSIKKAFVDGEQKELDIYPYISKEDRTMVPLRFISEYFGCSVEWIESTEEIIIRSEECTLKFKLNNPEYYINDKKYEMDVAPVLIDDARTFVPIRYIALALKCNIEYKQENGIEYVIIKSK